MYGKSLHLLLNFDVNLNGSKKSFQKKNPLQLKSEINTYKDIHLWGKKVKWLPEALGKNALWSFPK